MEPRRFLRTILLLALTGATLVGCAAETGEEDSVELGDISSLGKEDGFALEFPFALTRATNAGPKTLVFNLRVEGHLAVTAEPSGDAYDLELLADADGVEPAASRAPAPSVRVSGDANGGYVRYRITLRNHKRASASGTLRVRAVQPQEIAPGIGIIFNQPDCDDGCTDPTNGMLERTLTYLRGAQTSIDLAIYGIDQPEVLAVLCEKAQAGIPVRIVADDDSLEPGNVRGYYHSLLDENAGVVRCGVQVRVVKSNGIMHHKFFLLDRGTDRAVILTGSTNQTRSDYTKNHNHMIYLPGQGDLMEAYQAEFDQLFRRCATERLDGDMSRCTECIPSCTENRSAEGPWMVDDTEVGLYFSPSDDALRALRGKAIMRTRPTPDPACVGDDANCVCRKSGANFACEYCALESDGWGLIGSAQSRVMSSIYAGTDGCFFLGMAHAARRGLTTLSVWDKVNAASPYTRDDFVCGWGVPTYVTNWSNGSPLVRNHNKTIVIDDVVFDGSMNISSSGADLNNENTLILRGEEISDAFASYIESEAALLRRRGVAACVPAEGRCNDLVDNDGDGTTDAADADCDTSPH